jgi:hypothetical protein
VPTRVNILSNAKIFAKVYFYFNTKLKKMKKSEKIFDSEKVVI